MAIYRKRCSKIRPVPYSRRDHGIALREFGTFKSRNDRNNHSRCTRRDRNLCLDDVAGVPYARAGRARPKVFASSAVDIADAIRSFGSVWHSASPHRKSATTGPHWIAYRSPYLMGLRENRTESKGSTYVNYKSLLQSGLALIEPF
jgi:hypothetical protein